MKLFLARCSEDQAVPKRLLQFQVASFKFLRVKKGCKPVHEEEEDGRRGDKEGERRGEAKGGQEGEGGTR